MAANSLSYTEKSYQPSNYDTVTFDVGILSTGKRHSDSELAAEAEEMFQAICHLKQDHADLTARLTKSKIEQLESRREELVLDCRKALQEFTALQNKAGIFDATTRRLNEDLNRTGLNLRAAKETTLVPAYNTREDFAAHAEKIANLQSEFDRKFSGYNDHLMLISSFEKSLSAAADKHNSLVKAEAECRLQLSRAKGDKSPIIDSEFGLQR